MKILVETMLKTGRVVQKFAVAKTQDGDVVLCVEYTDPMGTRYWKVAEIAAHRDYAGAYPAKDFMIHALADALEEAQGETA